MRHRALPVVATALLAVWCFTLERLLQHRFFGLFHPALLGQVFNSMAAHLAAGRFDIDPDAIGGEAFLVGDRTVSYFGIFCALLRLPLLPFPALAHLDITGPSCLVAVCLGGWFQLRAVLAMRDAAPPGPRRDWLTVALIGCILLGGQQIQFLRASVFQEIVDWANALAMGFVFLATRGLIMGFNARILTGMAAFARLALLDRVSFGLGLYLALGGVLLLHWRLAFWPALVLVLFAAVTGAVNAGRWGNPLIFADFTRYALNQDQTPDRLVRLATYGEFNWRRIGLGLSYYFLPVWTLLRPDGHLLFAEARHALVDAMELPPSSFVVSDPVLVGLAVVGLRHLSPSRPNGAAGVALLAGLAVPPVLMLTAISMAYRYRTEFYPFLVLASLLGFRALCRAAGDPFNRRTRVAIAAAVVAGVLVSHATAALYAVSPWGPAEQYVEKDGWIGTFAPRLRAGHD